MTSADPTGHIAFITGGASGIGLAVAALLQRRERLEPSRREGSLARSASNGPRRLYG